MHVVSFKEFEQVYLRSVEEVISFWSPAMQDSIARHCAPWKGFDFPAYLRLSSLRFYRIYSMILAAKPTGRVCDVGGFWGVFPLTLHRLGLVCDMTEAMGYYDSCFDRLFARIRSSGVRVLDFDPFSSANPVPGTYDLVTALAVIEHYPHSLAGFMGSLTAMIEADGRILIEVPNIAFLPTRWRMVRGISPLPDIADIYRSATPFIGHHHEFTRAELRRLLDLAGLRVVAEDSYNYTIRASTGLRGALVRTALDGFGWYWPDTREVLVAMGGRK